MCMCKYMTSDIRSCLVAIKFIKEIYKSDQVITVDTQIYRKNNFYTTYGDLCQIAPESDRGINFDDILKLFVHMKHQFDNVTDDYLWISDIRYVKMKKMWVVFLKKYVPVNTNGADILIYVLDFIKQVYGLRNNVMLDSCIYYQLDSHNLDSHKFDLNNDIYELFGNADKKISIDDVQDLFTDVAAQMENVENTVKKKYSIKLLAFNPWADSIPWHKYPDYISKDSVKFRIWWNVL